MSSEHDFDAEIKKKYESGELDTPGEKILRRFVEKPELLDRLIRSFQEEPTEWVEMGSFEIPDKEDDDERGEPRP